MAQDDVGKGLEAIGDDAVRQQVAAGDFSALPDLDLTEEEKGMLVGAAEDYPETSGFAYDTLQPTQVAPAELGRFSLAFNYAHGLPGGGGHAM